MSRSSIPMMGGEDFSEYSLPDHSIPAVNFHFGAVDAGEDRGVQRGGKGIADPAFEQIRARSRADYSNRDDRNDYGGAGANEEVMIPSFRAKSRNPVAKPFVIPRDPSTSLRFARDDIA